MPPAGKVAVVACMDARLNVYGALGLQEGEGHIIRNAGGVITDDAIRSLAISQRLLGTEEIILIHHTDCGMLTFTDDEFKRSIHDEVGIEPQWAAESFSDLDENVRQSIARIKASPFLPHRDQRPRIRLRREHGRVARGRLSGCSSPRRSISGAPPDGRCAGDVAPGSQYTDVVAETNRWFRLSPPNTRLEASSGSSSLPSSVPSGSQTVDPVAGGRPHSAGVVETQPVERAVRARRRTAARPDSAPSSTSNRRMCLARESPMYSWVSSSEKARPFGRSKSSATMSHDPARRVDAVHVAAADLALGAMALVVAVDAVRRIGEPHRTVRVDDDVVRAVQPPAVVAVGEDGDRAVVLRSGHPAIAVFAASPAALDHRACGRWRSPPDGGTRRSPRLPRPTARCGRWGCR